MVEIKLHVSNADIEPLLERLDDARNAMVPEMVRDSAGDSGSATVFYAFTDRIMAQLRAHRDFLKLKTKHVPKVEVVEE